MADRAYLSIQDDPDDGSTPGVQYQCTGGQGNSVRRTGIIYPDGRHQRREADGLVVGDDEEGLSWHILGDVCIPHGPRRQDHR